MTRVQSVGASPRLTMRLLGPPDLRVDGAAAPPGLLWRKHLALLAYLALSPGRARTRDHLGGLLWADKDETAARHSLREAVRVIRQTLGADAVAAEGPSVRLTTSGIHLDAERFDAYVAVGDWEHAAGLVAGDFMEGFLVPGASAFDEWLVGMRRAWRRRLAEANVQVARSCLRAGQIEAARRAAGRALSAAPLSSAAVEVAMHAEALAGDLAAALQVFGTFQRRAQEAGTAPGGELPALADRIRSSLDRTVPPRPVATPWPDRS